MEERVVAKFSLPDWSEIVVRYPVEGDTAEMHRYINELSKEKTTIRFQGEEVSLEDETNYLKDQLYRIQNKTVVKLVAVCDGKIVGVGEVAMKDMVERHVGVLGISVVAAFRGKGLGKKLMELIISQSQKELPGLKIIILQVFGNNEVAINLYKELGFQQYGVLPEGIIYQGNYIDCIFMYKTL